MALAFSARLAASLAASACIVLASAGICAAQSFPGKPIHFVVPYGTGGSPDVMARVIGQKLSSLVGQPVIVDNRPGASGIIAVELVAKAPADGYTVLVADTGHLGVNPSLYPNLPYDPLKDLAPVTMAGAGPYYMAVNAALPVRSVKELIAYAKANPGLPYGSSGNGSTHHLGMELFKQLTGISMMHVPYKGVAQSVPAVVSGDVALILAAMPSLATHIKSGKIRAIAVTKSKRSPLMPDVPTVSESGVPGYEIDPALGFLVPGGTPADVVAKLNGDIVKVLKMPDAVQQLALLGIDPIASTPEQYTDAIRGWIRLYGKLVKDVGARID